MGIFKFIEVVNFNMTLQDTKKPDLYKTGFFITTNLCLGCSS